MRDLRISEIAAQHWPKGAVIITANQGGFLGPAIRIFQSLLSGQPAKRSHVLFYLGAEDGVPMGLSQNWRVVKQPVADYVGSQITVAWSTDHTNAKRERMISEALTATGRTYDWLGIIGQALSAITGIKWFRRKIQIPWKTFCSEFVVSVIRRNLEPGFVGGIKSVQVNPDEIDLWVRANWEWRSYRLLK